jgi:indoleamine 2,3-dioxygenase
MHFYVHSLPPNVDIRIPPPVAIPLLQICNQLQLPPVLTYSDTVLYNWAPISEGLCADSSQENMRCQTLFTGTSDEEEFFLCSARIELRGVEALNLMRTAMDEMFVGDKIAIQRITSCLLRISVVVHDLANILLSIRNGCNPDTFYHAIRPWLRGDDVDPGNRTWVFEGLDEVSGIEQPKELSGSSAVQCALFHALDIFLGINQYSHRSDLAGHSNSTSLHDTSVTFQPDFTHHTVAYLTRMQSYMPRHHRNLLQHLSTHPYSLRSTVQSSNDPDLLDAYNSAVNAVKEFRNVHLLIVATYIIGPSKRHREAEGQESAEKSEPLKGTGGSMMVQFLRGVRDQTAQAILPP